MFGDVLVNLMTPHAKKWAHDGKIDTVHASFRNVPHCAKPGCARTAKQVNQKSFDQIVGVMAKKNRSSAFLSCNSSEKFVADFARRRFDRDFLFRRERAYIC